MKIFVNGEATECADGTAVVELLASYGLAPEATLFERNGSALHRREWPATRLQPNDRCEILQVAAGG